MPWNSQTILIAFVIVTSVAVVLQAMIMLGILLSMKKAAKQSLEVAEDLRASIVPLAQSTRELVEKLGPQLVTVTTNIAAVTRDLREETADMRLATADLKERVHRQAVRMDGMLTTSLDKAEQVTALVEAAITTPVRQVNGVVQAVKAATERYFRVERRPAATHSAEDENMFL
jgi:hypothetical protein